MESKCELPRDCVHRCGTAWTNNDFCSLSENESHTWYNKCEYLIKTGRCKCS